MHADSHLRRLVLALALVGAILVVAAPASAGIPEAGSRINLYGPPTTFSAGTPFHVTHGFGCDFSEVNCPAIVASTSVFSLYVDGVLQPSQVFVQAGRGGFGKFWLVNFYDGLPAGDHTLVGVWTQDGVVIQTLTAKITFA